MYLYICVFLIYPTFVGSECNKVIVIVIIASWRQWRFVASAGMRGLKN